MIIKIHIRVQALKSARDEEKDLHIRTVNVKGIIYQNIPDDDENDTGMAAWMLLGVV